MTSKAWRSVSEAMNVVHGDYFAPRSAQALACVASVESTMLALDFESSQPSLREIVSSVQGRTLILSNGGQFTADTALPEAWEDALQSTSQSWIRRAEKFHVRGILVLVVAFIALLSLYRLALPRFSDWVAVRVPENIEQRIGERSYDGMVSSRVLKPSLRSAQEREQLLVDYTALLNASGIEVNPRLAVHHSPLLGPNALAFPGGPVVITDQLLDQLNDEQTLAVLAHELAHVEARHALKQTTRIGALGIGMTLIFDNDIGVVEEMSSAAIATYGLSMSRSMESEADALAVEYLDRAEMQPQLLIEALETLHGTDCSGVDLWQSCSTNMEWLSTHPSGQRRLQELDETIRLR